MMGQEEMGIPTAEPTDSIEILEDTPYCLNPEVL